MQQNAVIGKYMGIFALAYAVGVLILSSILGYFDLDQSSGAVFAVLIGAAGLLQFGTAGIEEWSQIGSQLGFGIVTAVQGFTSLLCVAVLYFSYGALANKHYTALKNDGKV